MQVGGVNLGLRILGILLSCGTIHALRSALEHRHRGNQDKAIRDSSIRVLRSHTKP
jgi:hypothetical protein